MAAKNLRSSLSEPWRSTLSLSAADSLRPWLEVESSLTAAIRSRCHRFEVQVLQQRPARLLPDESRALSLRPKMRTLLREVLLLADGEPVVFAHSIVLPRDIRGVWHPVLALGNRPLGALLFADPSVRREPLHFVRLDAHDLRHRRATTACPEATPDLWARRRVFRKQGRPLLVTEVFLPAIARLGR